MVYGFIEKIIQPGATEEFFVVDLDRYEAFDWNIKTTMPSTGARGLTKVSSLYTGDIIESTKYAILGASISFTLTMLVYFMSSLLVYHIVNRKIVKMEINIK